MQRGIVSAGGGCSKGYICMQVGLYMNEYILTHAHTQTHIPASMHACLHIHLHADKIHQVDPGSELHTPWPNHPDEAVLQTLRSHLWVASSGHRWK